VAGGNGKSTRCVVVLDGELNRRRGCHPDVHHVAAHRLESGYYHRLEHRPRYSAVATDNNAALSSGALSCPRSKSSSEFCDNLRGERFSHAPAHAGDAHHQSFISQSNILLVGLYLNSIAMKNDFGVPNRT
jgi:hypothetical protein